MGETWGKGTILFYMVKTAGARGGRAARMPEGRMKLLPIKPATRKQVFAFGICALYTNRVALTLYASQSLRNWGRYIKCQ